MAKLVSDLSIDFDKVAVLSDLNDVDNKMAVLNTTVVNNDVRLGQTETDVSQHTNDISQIRSQLTDLQLSVEQQKPGSTITFEQLTLSVLQIIQENNQEVIDRLDGTDDDTFTGDIIDGGGATSDGYEM